MDWSWPLFAWGVGVGVVGVAGSYAIGRAARLSYHQWRAYVGLMVMSLCVAISAALVPSTSIDVIFTVIVAVTNFALPLLLLLRISRRMSPHACGSDASCSANACATCPLAAQATAPLSGG